MSDGHFWPSRDSSAGRRLGNREHTTSSGQLFWNPTSSPPVKRTLRL
jgi:hypothetical protein